MKNSHFNKIASVAIAVLFLSGCGTAAAPPPKQEPVGIIALAENTATQNTNATKTTNQTNTVKVVDPTPTPTPKQTTITYNLAEVSKHNNENDCWAIIDGKIYNITGYIPQHPGGPGAIIRSCGKDGTSIFDLKHSPDKKQYLTPYFVANLQ